MDSTGPRLGNCAGMKNRSGARIPRASRMDLGTRSQEDERGRLNKEVKSCMSDWFYHGKNRSRS